jgi:hypothetical protein
MLTQLRLYTLIALLCCHVASAQADPRFIVVLDKATADATLDGQIQQALPQLWNRILPLNNPVGIPLVSNPQSVLQRVQKGREHITLELNNSAIFPLLQQQGIPMLRRMPHIRLNISLLNTEGKPMVHSQRLLEQEAATLARQWGLALDTDASEVNMVFTWLDSKQVALQISGSALLSDIQENRTMKGDSFTFLKAWLQDNLLQLRDTLAADHIVSPSPVPPAVVATVSDAYSDTNSDDYSTASTDAYSAPAWTIDGTLIVIHKPMPLSQQLLFERAMRKEQRVESLIPVSFSVDEQRYALKLRSGDDVWLKSWFEQHGMHATRLDQGWLIR